MLKLKSIKTQVILFLTAFAVYLSIIDKTPEFLLNIFLCLVFTVLVEGVFIFIKNRKFSASESSVITGLILGFVLAGGQAWYIYLAAAVLAIGSKHLIRFNKKHIFNPATFGIITVAFFLGATTQWKGTYLWYVLVPVGIYFTYRIRKLELLFSYFVVALGLWGAQALSQNVPIKYIFGYLSYFFVLIMMIEPKTTPITRSGKIIFAIIVASAIFILTNIGVRFDVELGSLLIANATVPFLNLLKRKKKEV